MSDRLKHLTQLLDSQDPKVRLYALDEVIRNAHRLTEGELADVLERCTVDQDRVVALRASEGLTILEQRGFKQLRRARNRRSTLSVSPESDEADGNALEAAYRILDLALRGLGDLAGDLSVSRANAALEALGAFRYPGSLGPLLKALSRRDTGQGAARALAGYPEEACLPIFKKLLRAPTYPEALAVTLSVFGEIEGPDSFLVLEQHAGDPDEKVRESVAMALGGRIERGAEDILVKLLRDPSPRVVQAAVTSLGLVGEGKAAEHLHSLFLDVGDVRLQAAILTALGLIHRAESVDVIAKGLRSPDGRVRANAIEALSGFNLRPPEAIRYLDPALKDENNRAAGNAILAIYPYDKDRAVAILQKLLKAKEALKRSTAAYIIGELQDPLLMQGLITMINTEQDRTVLSSSLTSIERIRNPEMKVGISKLCQHPNDLIRGKAIQIFAGMSGLSELKVLESFFKKESSPTVRATIVAAFGHVCDMNHLSFVKTKLRDPDDRIVANAVEALDRVGSLENQELIEPLLSHRSTRVRANALIALWHQGNLRAGDRLAEMLGSSEDDDLASALHAAHAFASSISSMGLKRYPLLRSSLQSAFERMSSMGVNSWDMFRSTQFYQDVILEGPPEAPTAEELSQVPDDPAGADDGTLAMRMDSAIQRAPDQPGAAAPVTESAARTEAALVTGLGALLAGQPAKAREVLGRDLPPGPLDGVRTYLARRAAQEEGVPPDGSELADDPELPFLPLHISRIEQSRRSHDLAGSLAGYFSMYRAQLALLESLIGVGERTLESGHEAEAAKIARDLAQWLKTDSSVHRKLGNLFFAEKDYPAAFDHLLRAWAHTPDEPDLVLRLASVAARIGKKRLAKAMVQILVDKMDAPDELREKASGLGRILES